MILSWEPLPRKTSSMPARNNEVVCVCVCMIGRSPHHAARKERRRRKKEWFTSRECSRAVKKRSPHPGCVSWEVPPCEKDQIRQTQPFPQSPARSPPPLAARVMDDGGMKSFPWNPAADRVGGGGGSHLLSIPSFSLSAPPTPNVTGAEVSRGEADTQLH